MAQASALFAGHTDTRVLVRVVGRGTFQNGRALRAFSLEMIGQGCRQFYVDLAECHGMDSTFLGVLAGIGLRLGEVGQGGCLSLCNIGGRDRELVQTLGLDRVLRLEACMPGALQRESAEVELRELPGWEPRAQAAGEAAALVLHAHDDLCRVDRGNEERFRDVIRLLRESTAGRGGRTREGH
ncbi:MAG: STAS domain-containing protein [Candidatus Binatia bacterium]